MKVQWTGRAVSDLGRLYDCLAPVNGPAAIAVVRSLTTAAGRLPEHPRIGEQVEAYAPREVRRLIVGAYELRYELRAPTVYILRIWHTRERR